MKHNKQYTPRRTAAQWHQIVEAQRASGLSAPTFCTQKDISYPSFTNWRKKLALSTSTADATLPTFIELTPEPDVTASVTTVADTQPLTIELDLGAGVHLRIYRAS